MAAQFRVAQPMINPKPLRVVAHCDTWPADFAAVRSELIAAFAGQHILVEHIGSTSVPGLCAKPVIDVLVGADSLARIEAAIPQLQAAGYDYVSKYEAELPMRRYFVKPESQSPRVHVHAVCLGSEFWQEQLLFRDTLRADTAVRDAYAKLKLELARVHANDKAAYTDAKGPFIRDVLALRARSRGAAD
jgi:GrpB-like predicted nucleotidyltransferase (UPF0157 family)